MQIMQRIASQERDLMALPKPVDLPALVADLQDTVAHNQARLDTLEAILLDHQAGAIERQAQIDRIDATERKLRHAQRLGRTP
jgi:hypothetical protein